MGIFYFVFCLFDKFFQQKKTQQMKTLMNEELKYNLMIESYFMRERNEKIKMTHTKCIKIRSKNGGKLKNKKLLRDRD